MTPHSKRFRSMLVAGSLLAGVGLGAAGIASASSGPSVDSASAPPPDPATAGHGPGETRLSGRSLALATAAARAAEPHASIIRVETDSSGAAYEAHMSTGHGSTLTVKLDARYRVTSVDDGFGSAPAGAVASDPGASHH